MVAGGREGLVGVGGLLTGGGKTFYTCRYGFGCGSCTPSPIPAHTTPLETHRKLEPRLITQKNTCRPGRQLRSSAGRRQRGASQRGD